MKFIVNPDENSFKAKHFKFLGRWIIRSIRKRHQNKPRNSGVEGHRHHSEFKGQRFHETLALPVLCSCTSVMAFLGA
jgi:hypothetical protein